MENAAETSVAPANAASGQKKRGTSTCSRRMKISAIQQTSATPSRICAAAMENWSAPATPISARKPTWSNRSSSGASSARASVMFSDILSRLRTPDSRRLWSGSGSRRAHIRAGHTAGTGAREPEAEWSPGRPRARASRFRAGSAHKGRRSGPSWCRRCEADPCRTRHKGPRGRPARGARRASSPARREQPRGPARAADRAPDRRRGWPCPRRARQRPRSASGDRRWRARRWPHAKRSGGQRRKWIRAPTWTMTRRLTGRDPRLPEPLIDCPGSCRIGPQFSRVCLRRRTRDPQRVEQIPLIVDRVSRPQRPRPRDLRRVEPRASSHFISDARRRS